MQMHFKEISQKILDNQKAMSALPADIQAELLKRIKPPVKRKKPLTHEQRSKIAKAVAKRRRIEWLKTHKDAVLISLHVSQATRDLLDRIQKKNQTLSSWNILITAVLDWLDTFEIDRQHIPFDAMNCGRYLRINKPIAKRLAKFKLGKTPNAALFAASSLYLSHANRSR